ncbi:MAG TPA: FHA domain-containing protein [Gemmataceae bacterium]|nr:FHA domain-containing protein [Gemmataceae bacterium]
MKQSSPDQFLQSCGALGPLQFEVEHPDRRATICITLPLPFALVGRDEHADLSLKDARVSLRHTYLQVVNGRLWWADLDSREGTHGREGRQSTGRLDSDRPLGIGPFHLRLLGGCLPDKAGLSSLANPFSGDAYDLLSLPRVRLDFVEGTAKPSLWMVDRPLTLVGRASCCKIRLRSPLVSRTHCALLSTAAGLWAIDLRGREGLHVNGTAVRWALLEDADELRIGQFRIRVYAPGVPESKTFSNFSPASMEANGPPPATSIVPSPTFAETLPAELGSLLSSVVPTGGGGANESLLMPFIAQFSLMQQQMFDQFQQALTMMVHMFSGLHDDQMRLVHQEVNQLRELTRELQGLTTELARQTLVPSRETVAAPSPGPITPPAAAPAFPTPSHSLSPHSSASAEPAPFPSSPPARSNADVHAWLSQRLAALQQERQSRWQKILHVLTGKRVEKTVP